MAKRSPCGTVTNSFRYTAREWDAETGLYYYRARYYEPQSGRFASEDPIRFGAGIDFYAYVLSAPTIFTDPLGLATLQYWAPRYNGPWKERYGHVSLLLDDGTYISFYPTNFNLLHANSPVESLFSPDLEADIAAEGGAPDVTIKLDNLDEAAIIAWWDNYKKTHPNFRGLSNNCSTVLSQALNAGGAQTHVPEFGVVPVWTPDILLKYAKQIEKAGHGVYIEPEYMGHVVK